MEEDECCSLDAYFDNVVMKMNRDAQGILLYVVPLVLRINAYIVNVDTHSEQEIRLYIEQCQSRYDSIEFKQNDALDLHD